MITPYYAHSHIMRTAGQRIRGLAHELNIGVLNDSTHLSYRAAEKWCQAVGMKTPPGIVVVRNPWAWQVSRYFYRRKLEAQHDPGTFWLDNCGDGPEGFTRHLRAIAHHVRNDALPQDASGNTPTRSYLWLTFSQWWHEYAPGCQYIVKFERLADELPVTLSALVPGLDMGSVRDKLGTIVNASDHGAYADYYTDETRDMVAEWSADVIKQFGYTFGD